MKKYLFFVLLVGFCFLFAQNNISQHGNKSLIGLTNFIDQGNSIRPFLNDSSNFGHHQNLSFRFGINMGIPSSIYSYNNTLYYKINNSLIADANFTLSNFIGSQYEEKYGYQLLASSDLNDSYSGDGLIVAKGPHIAQPDLLEISHRSNDGPKTKRA